jgi:hypothetical protein
MMYFRIRIFILYKWGYMIIFEALCASIAARRSEPTLFRCSVTVKSRIVVHVRGRSACGRRRGQRWRSEREDSLIEHHMTRSYNATAVEIETPMIAGVPKRTHAPECVQSL